jgi:endonuclease YncB( thermonuclease family)
MPIPIIAAGLMFTCTPTMVYDGDGPITCREGPHVRLAGVAARERDGTCRPGQPCPPASAEAALAALTNLLGGSRGTVSFHGSPYAHVRVHADPLYCLSMGSAGGTRTAAFCRLRDGEDLSCAMLQTKTVLIWARYWPTTRRCNSRKGP